MINLFLFLVNLILFLKCFLSFLVLKLLLDYMIANNYLFERQESMSVPTLKTF